jgi:hypothetical protein
MLTTAEKRVNAENYALLAQVRMALSQFYGGGCSRLFRNQVLTRRKLGCVLFRLVRC